MAATGLTDGLSTRGGGLGDRECESRRLPLRRDGGDRLFCLVRVGEGDRESYEAERLFFLPRLLLTDELFRLLTGGPAFPRGRPR